MVNIETLNELSQLSRSGFGQPPPRHGLNLLYWFAHEFVDIDTFGRLVPKVSPKNGAYGFHRFHNFQDDDEYTLPNQKLLYYEVGNLNASGADKLPFYVRKDFTNFADDSNKDRIMVRLKDDYLDRVYISEHSDPSRFGRTCRITQGLIANIKRLEREEFLRQVKSSYQFHHQAYINSYTETQPKNDSWCSIL
ncbi:uncharacterized protein [Hoplias malabaricus]